MGEEVRDATLILTGRAGLSEEQQARLQRLRVSGSRIEYRQVDVRERAAVEQLVREVHAGYGKLNGILHCAGVIHDSFLLNKTAEELEGVLAPKVQGVVNLDGASQESELDMFILFSSLAGVLGNVGQADYAAANAFMDYYAHYRNRLVQEGKRRGQTLSIDWPLWAEGGMRVDLETERRIRHSGMIPLGLVSGMKAFYQS